MKKENIRKVFFKLKFKGHSYSQCRKILKATYGYGLTIRTLQRWNKKLNSEEWDFRDASRRPKKIYYKITSEMEKKIISIKKEMNKKSRENKKEYDKSYHKRSNVESANQSKKMLHGDKVYSKLGPARINEESLRWVNHNINVLNRAMCEWNVIPPFME